MVTNRPLAQEDLSILQSALEKSPHPDQKVEHYVGANKYSEIYSDESGAIGILRYTKTLRLCATWVDNEDRARNAQSIIQAVEDAVVKAKANGFNEIIFQTDSPSYAKFCVNKLGFLESRGEFIKFI
jgi:hypothetical protein